MRARLAGLLRRAANRLAPDTDTHHLGVSTTTSGAVAVYIDGRGLSGNPGTGVRPGRYED